MQLGIIGLGRMGANMALRLLDAGHTCVGYDVHPPAVEELRQKGADGAATLEELVGKLEQPRVIWMMLPAAIVDRVMLQLIPQLAPGDILVDGGNSFYQDDIRRGKELTAHKLHYVDVGVSGGIWGYERGYCQMIGGEAPIVQHLDPIFAALAPGDGGATPTRGRNQQGSTAEKGYLHCGPNGAGHFVKMVHNGIEYGMMAAYAEGFNILKHANIGKSTRTADAETTPLRYPEHFQFEIDLPDVAEVWRRGSVIGSWLLDLTAQALQADPELADFTGHVSDSGEGRWTVTAAIEEAVPAPVISAALYARFSSRGEDDYADKLISAMRAAFGGHAEKPHSGGGDAA